MIRIYPTTFKGDIEAMPSKSHAHRLLVAAALSTAPTTIGNLPECDDIDTTLECLKELGCTVERLPGGEIKLHPFPKTSPVPKVELNFKQSGTTAHLLLPVIAAMGMDAECKASGTLLKRTLIPLSSRMALRGIKFSNFNFPLTMTGTLQPGDYVFAGDEGSQYISGALMALPLLRSDSKIELSSPLIDDSYIDITLSSMKEFGVSAEITEYGFRVPGRQVYKSPGTIAPENDWALGTMWACAGCLSKSDDDLVRVIGLPANSVQMYRNFKYAMSLLRHDVKYLNVDASGCPNLACLYAIFGASKGSGMDIVGVPQLKFEETDRLKAVAECVKALGVSAQATEDGIKMQKRENFDYPEDTLIDCKGDPWIFMSMALAAGCLPKPVILDDERCPEKVYRNFLADYKRLGGKYEILDKLP